ncbi:C-type mannose receptor 2-like [Alosa pseudoharengus]|uniref:C-type mannose receptor 2-like n=1 Tax=Alosa pseudoharengus TaxID=34774 RepID=UPI003F8C1138
MAHWGCFLLLFLGLCSLSSSVPRQFHVVKEQKSWTEAQQYCREKFTDLATIDDMTEMEKVKSLIHEAGVKRAWIGLKQGKWQWSLADRGFYRENETDFRNWGNPQPDGGDQECVYKGENGKWHDDRCSHSHHFICYDGGNSTHPYVLVTDKKNWADAQRYCRERHTDLASVRNQKENEQIEEVSGRSSVWIGLFRDAWEWSEGSSSSFRHWNTGEPNYGSSDEFCAEILNAIGGRWNDARCDNHQIPFICYEEKLLVLVCDNKTWTEALQYCREHHVDLVSVTSERVQRWVRARAKGASTAHVWLGLRHACGLGWFWVCGETVCYNHWAPGQEQVESFQQRVGAVESGGGQWVSNLTETDKLNFICTTVEQCD